MPRSLDEKTTGGCGFRSVRCRTSTRCRRYLAAAIAEERHTMKYLITLAAAAAALWAAPAHADPNSQTQQCAAYQAEIDQLKGEGLPTEQMQNAYNRGCSPPATGECNSGGSYVSGKCPASDTPCYSDSCAPQDNPCDSINGLLHPIDKLNCLNAPPPDPQKLPNGQPMPGWH